MTLDEFMDMLRKHDWYYHYSDDHRVFVKGAAERNEIEKAKYSRQDLEQAYQQYIQEMPGVLGL